MDGITIKTTEGPVLTLSDLAWRVVGTGDFDGDGKSDLLWRHALSRQLYVWPMDGTSIEPTHGQVMDTNGVVPVPEDDWQVYGAGDLDGDGKSDVVWRNGLTKEVYIWPMNGTVLQPTHGTVRDINGAAPTPDANWQFHGIGDFDGDGKDDLLWRHAVSRELYIWPMDGTTLKASNGPVKDSNGVTLTPAGYWQVYGVGDFDGDGKSDIVWLNGSSGELYVWPLNGTVLKATHGTVRDTNGVPPVPEANWKFRGTGDFDGDGKSDLLWRHAVTRALYIWPMDGTTLKPSNGTVQQSSGSVPTPSEDWNIAGIGDYDGDGKADIFWRRGQDQQPSREYIYLGDIPVAVFSSQMSSGPGYIHVDHLNTPRLVANATGTTVWRWDQQEPFGVNVPDEDPDGNSVTLEFPLAFPGQYADMETNLYYNYYRDYDPSLGSYKQSDLIGLKGGLNTYVYVNADPLRLSDLFGLYSKYWHHKFTVDGALGAGLNWGRAQMLGDCRQGHPGSGIRAYARDVRWRPFASSMRDSLCQTHSAVPRLL
jgi:RHS repeat-associated protein